MQCIDMAHDFMRPIGPGIRVVAARELPVDTTQFGCRQAGNQPEFLCAGQLAKPVHHVTFRRAQTGMVLEISTLKLRIITWDIGVLPRGGSRALSRSFAVDLGEKKETLRPTGFANLTYSDNFKS
ncbi:hypothetical protein R3X27_02505 [Tropicimonas sp. TH_r6]|uniref:hypothetical protein n=1 Tax=Tropicimonas sp. TH_r6 TaxID=3082085 RepID=UPI0029530CD5|nr:hypothetical protein [Tropicimonas sp. TH_r6]MDV7141546.1 hypothetical protein [Tropicimonas sp. TH_r6]